MSSEELLKIEEFINSPIDVNQELGWTMLVNQMSEEELKEYFNSWEKRIILGNFKWESMLIEVSPNTHKDKTKQYILRGSTIILSIELRIMCEVYTFKNIERLSFSSLVNKRFSIRDTEEYYLMAFHKNVSIELNNKLTKCIELKREMFSNLN